VGRPPGERRREIEFSALPSQKKFLESAARFKGFSGPIGSGKSQVLCQEAIRLSYQNPGRTGLIGAPTYPMLRDATLAALIEVLDLNGIPYEWNRSENFLVMKETRSRVLLRAVEEFERLRGSNLAWFGIDELTYAPEDAWLRLEGRLRDPKATRLCGFGVWTPKGYDWVHRRFIAERVEGYETVQAQPFENRFLLDRVPDYYERLKSSYDARLFEQEALGSYFPSNGLGSTFSGMPFYDAWTQAEFEARYEHAMEVFYDNEADPEAYADEVEFLAAVIGEFTDAIMSYVRETHSTARFEVLYPFDVNQTAFNKAINFPVEAWTPAALDCLKTEGLGFTFTKELKKSEEGIEMGGALGFAADQRSHLVGLGDSAAPWLKEMRIAEGKGFESVVGFALDQFCLIGCRLPLRGSDRRGTRVRG